MLEVLEGRFRPTQLAFAEGESEKGAFVDRRNTALLLVDRQFEPPAEVCGDARLDALARPLTANQYQKVIGVARKAMAATLQFPIQIIKDVGEQR